MKNVKLHTFAPLVLVIGDFIDCGGRKLVIAYRPPFLFTATSVDVPGPLRRRRRSG